MKILFFCRRFYPDIGGVEKHVWEVSQYLAKKGYVITVVTESQKKHKKEPSIKNITIIRIPKKDTKNKKFFIWHWLWQNRNIIRKADVIHCHDVFYWYLPFRFLFPFKPVYTTFHGYESFPIKKKAIIVRKVSELFSWGNICIGDFIAKWYRTKPTFVSFGAVDSSQFTGNTNSSYLKKESAVFIGRLDEQTGVLTYLKAYERLKKKYPEFVFLIVGDGKYKSLVSKKVRTVGFQTDPEKYFKKYHFAFVSRYLSILGAFAARRLVVAIYDNPVKEDYLRVTPFAPFMIIENNPEKIVQKINFFLHNPKIEKKIVENAYSFAKKQSWEKMARLYITLWKLK